MIIDARLKNYTFNGLRDSHDEVGDVGNIAPITLFGLEEVVQGKKIRVILTARVANMVSTVDDTVWHYSLQHNLCNEHLSNVYYNT